MNDADIRRQLHELADEYGSSDRLRAEVRARLEAIDDLPASALVAPPPERRRGGSYLLVAAASLAIIGAGVAAVLALGRGDDTGRVATDDTTVELPVAPQTSAPAAAPPSTLVQLPASTQRYETTLTEPQFAFDLPAGDGITVSDGVESSDRVELSVSTSEVVDGHLVIAVPLVGDVDSAGGVIEPLQASLSQVEFVDAAEVDLGGVPATRVRLRSDVDMTLVGFRLGPSTFITASGVDRSYEAYVLDRPDRGVVVIWIDAGSDGIDAMRSVAGLVAASLEW